MMLSSNVIDEKNSKSTINSVVLAIIAQFFEMMSGKTERFILSNQPQGANQNSSHVVPARPKLIVSTFASLPSSNFVS